MLASLASWRWIYILQVEVSFFLHHPVRAGGNRVFYIIALKYVLIYKRDIQMKWCCNSWRVSVIHKVTAAVLIHIIFFFGLARNDTTFVWLPCYFGVFPSSRIDIFVGIARNSEWDSNDRSAKLSEGQITDGNLECLYHGWQFNGAGTCVKIPQV
jgi:hypothetical protein